MTREITEAEYRETIEIMGHCWRSSLKPNELAEKCRDNDPKWHKFYDDESYNEYNKYRGMEEIASKLFGKTTGEIFDDVVKFVVNWDMKHRY